MNPEIYPEYPILIVDDEENFLNSMKVTLKSTGINNIEFCQDSRKVMSQLNEKGGKYYLILLDIIMPGISGDNLLLQIKENYPEIPIIMLTAVNDTEMIVECMKKGSMDYIIKPPEGLNLVNTIQKALDVITIKKENELLKQSIFSDKPNYMKPFEHIITQDKRMIEIFKYIESISRSPEPVLITGETGVGKELIARALHYASKRHGQFVPENVAGLDDQLFSDTLFGHKKGAFTGAVQNRKGLVKQAEAGTFFLDEIGDLSIRSQISLLRLLQEKEYSPLGAENKEKTNARLVAATNQDLELAIKEGRFRRDLYYRLQVHQIFIPPLRERKEDIPLLVNHFIEKASKKMGIKISHVPGVLFTLLSGYSFPGNTRELETLIDDSVSRSQERGTLSIEPFYEKIGKLPEPIHPEVILEKPVENNLGKEKGVIFCGTFPDYNQMEKIYLEEALKQAGGNQSEAAKKAGLARTTFLNKLKKVKKVDIGT